VHVSGDGRQDGMQTENHFLFFAHIIVLSNDLFRALQYSSAESCLGEVVIACLRNTSLVEMSTLKKAEEKIANRKTK
jgi:hypothetical protein